ncbi:phosphopantetheine-binding protein [Lentzea sp. NPDC058436]|uniref:phosphopantetheine-binding protein n=1 Tax=Lentzea sp. NPDC058436 TaxID=3346499 RepID=UPI003646864E
MAQLTFDAVRADIAEKLYLEPDELSDTADLFDEGMDSVTLVDLIEQWREHGASISFAELAEKPTLRAWWDVLRPAGG